MKPIIEVKNIGKKYKITHQQGGYIALRDVLASIAKQPFVYLRAKATQAVGLAKKEDFWALRNVNFNLEQGEVIGIIGRNGAGKSTLLKILTGITPPTEGEIIMRGRVASLLEVGTGFHPELTGRENIFLNGAILGMKKKEIAAKFDEIVAFAGIEKFLDTPVKRYSSGMYVRLAFSVAAHMEPDILLVDEVLAVGDAEFQKKCLGKMEEVTQQAGRTIIFVSHNMSAIQSLCKKCILIEKGVVKKIGPTKDIIDLYLSTKSSTADASLATRKDRRGSGKIVFTECTSLFDPQRKTLSFVIHYSNTTGTVYNNVKISVDIKNQEDIHLANITNSVLEQVVNLDAHEGTIKLDIDHVNLATGHYSASLFLASDHINSEIFDWIEDACIVEIENSGFYKTSRLPPIPSQVLFDFRFH